AWDKALEGDPVSAFGGVLIANSKIDLQTAEKIDKIFYEVLIAPGFDSDALELVKKKKKRIILKIKEYPQQEIIFKKTLNGLISQDADTVTETGSDLKTVTKISPSENEIEDLLFANKVVKHLKSNAIAFVKDKQLLGMGCGQTSRVDACRQGIEKAQRLGLDLKGAVMSSDAFFPFPDSIELAHQAGIKSVIQPGGSIKDNLSIEYCDENSISMVMTGNRHFKH
ncbi:MAG TPA: bifunctional phosphoribosylaminoimidazolecarboxamide formyltransferase/IMP cyclohydrolase PurH, partial [Bacteroidetes bacterium]|nr:bifunctional phosphoribosylaminoimidazolecarboxamide formyltransferase/IMP cyclohydrolase PurH [Bacteroidota bacterium]